MWTPNVLRWLSLGLLWRGDFGSFLIVDVLADQQEAAEARLAPVPRAVAPAPSVYDFLPAAAAVPSFERAPLFPHRRLRRPPIRGDHAPDGGRVAWVTRTP